MTSSIERDQSDLTSELMSALVALWYEIDHHGGAGASEFFTPDAELRFSDAVFHGAAEIEQFLERTMAYVPGVYTAMMWYSIDGDRVVWKGMNWADNLKEPGGPKVGFETIQLLEYGGDGKFKSEEDWWVMFEMQRFGAWYNTHSEHYRADGKLELSRKDWGPWVDWARPQGEHPAQPSWLGKDVKPILSLKDIDFGVRNPGKDYGEHIS